LMLPRFNDSKDCAMRA